MFSNLLKFILGIFLAIAILIGTGVATALYFMNRTAIPPTKPIFSNDRPAQKIQTVKATEKVVTKASPAAETAATPTPTPSPTPTETPKVQESPKPLPPGAYQGKVTWPQGLSLRTEPKQDAERVGGVGFNQKIVVLEESDDKLWQKIRQEDTNQEGWVKAGNTQRIEENEEVQQPAKPQPEKPQQDQ